jgi:hypothetical protein
MILWFAAGVGIISFLVRIAFPVGWTLNPLGFQLAHFPQYMALFILGLVASKYNWLDTFPYNEGKKFPRYAARLLLFLTAIFVIQTVGKMPNAWFVGGLHWLQLLYAVLGAINGLFNCRRPPNVWKSIVEQIVVLNG